MFEELTTEEQVSILCLIDDIDKVVGFMESTRYHGWTASELWTLALKLGIEPKGHVAQCRAHEAL